MEICLIIERFIKWNVAGVKGLYSIPATISEFNEKDQRKYENCRQSRMNLSEILRFARPYCWSKIFP